MNIGHLRHRARASLADAINRSLAPSPGLTQFRTRGLLSLCLFGWLSTAVFIILSLTVVLHFPVPAVLVSVLLNLMPTIAARRARYDWTAWLPGAVMAALQPALLVYLLQDHHWQMEGHMYFFVGLAALTLLCDWRPLLVATLTIAVHHFALGYFLPAWVFMGGWAFSRVMIHAAAVIFVFILSAQMSLLTSDLLNQQSSVGDAKERIANEAEASRKIAEDALAALRQAEVETGIERGRREQAEADAQQTRVTALQSLGTEFENSVAGIAAAVSAAAVQLELSAKNMSQFARTTGEQAAEVMNQAHHASESAGQVSQGVSALSRSIQSVAQSSSEQSLLGEAARLSTSEGERTLRALAERTANVGAFIELIKGVATQTNLLALNATIEAARAGEAGRGFAVVANEVKTLAAQARTATDEVTELVSTIGTGAERADRALSDVAAAMSTMLEHASTVKKEIERQRATAEMIERTAEQSASGVGAMSQHCTQVAHAASEASKLSSEVQEAATRLAAIAQELQGATGQFVAQLRAA